MSDLLADRCQMAVSLAFHIVFAMVFFFSSRRRHTRCSRDWSSDVCSSDLKVLYEISTGRDRRDFPALPDDLAEDDAMLELNAVILKTCKNDLRERYQTAAELQGDLALLQSGRSVKRLQVVERRLALATKLGF